MIKGKTLWFDLDDTLIHTQELYNEVKQECVGYIQQNVNDSSVTSEQIIEKMSAIDVENVKIYGLSPERFPASWVQTYVYFCGNSAVGKEVIQKMAEQVFTKQAELIADAQTILQLAKEKHYTLNLLTAGDVEVQQRRIDQSELAPYFDSMVVVPLKTPEVMKQVIKEPETAVMIGNSLKSDIHPALTLGMAAVHIERNTWGYDQHEINSEDPNYIQLQTIQELKNYL